MVLHLIIFSLEWHDSGLINTENWNSLSSAKRYSSKFRLWLIKGQSTKKQNKTKGNIIFLSVCQPEFPWKSIIKKQKNKTGRKDPEPSSINLELKRRTCCSFSSSLQLNEQSKWSPGLISVIYFVANVIRGNQRSNKPLWPRKLSLVWTTVTTLA